MLTVETASAAIAFAALIIAAIALTQARKANRLAAYANTYAEEANTTAREALDVSERARLDALPALSEIALPDLYLQIHDHLEALLPPIEDQWAGSYYHPIVWNRNDRNHLADCHALYEKMPDGDLRYSVGTALDTIKKIHALSNALSLTVTRAIKLKKQLDRDDEFLEALASEVKKLRKLNQDIFQARSILAASHWEIESVKNELLIDLITHIHKLTT